MRQMNPTFDEPAYRKCFNRHRALFALTQTELIRWNTTSIVFFFF